MVLCELKGGEELDKLKNKLRNSNSILVGYFKGLLYDNNIPVAQVASWNEFGTDTIPARPFIRNCIRNNRKKWIKLYKDNVIRNNKLDLNYIANIIVGDVKTSIDKTIEPPNKQSTIAKKKSSHPLIDTGRLKNSITYRIINNNEST